MTKTDVVLNTIAILSTAWLVYVTMLLPYGVAP